MEKKKQSLDNFSFTFSFRNIIFLKIIYKFSKFFKISSSCFEVIAQNKKKEINMKRKKIK